MKRLKKVSRRGLVKKHMGLAVSQAVGFYHSQSKRYELDVLISIAFERLCYARRKFKRKKKVPFGAYAKDVIQHGFSNYRIRQNRPSRKIDQPTDFIPEEQHCHKHEHVDPVEIFLIIKKFLNGREYRLIEKVYIEGQPKATVAKFFKMSPVRFEKWHKRILEKLRERFLNWEWSLD